MILSKNPPEEEAEVVVERHDSALITSIAIIGSIFGVLLLFVFLSWLFCLWQAQLKQSAAMDASSGQKASPTPQLCSHQPLKLYSVRSYIGCLPRCGGPYKAVQKERECRMGSCWFSTCCCCCQELKPHQRFLDEKLTVPIALLEASTGRRQLISPTSPVARVKMSILAPDSIVVPSSRNEAPVPASEHLDSVDFYSYRLQGVNDDKIMY